MEGWSTITGTGWLPGFVLPTFLEYSGGGRHQSCSGLNPKLEDAKSNQCDATFILLIPT